MSDKPHIPLSELRRLWRMALVYHPTFGTFTSEIFRLLVSKRSLEAELTTLRARIAELEGEKIDKMELAASFLNSVLYEDESEGDNE